MNIVNKLTIRQLMLNKRRTLVTIIGVIISAAMITAVMTISTSFLNLLQRQAISDGGKWHVQYQLVNKDQLELIENNDLTKAMIISRDVGYAKLEGSQNAERPYLFVKAYNTEGFTNFPIELLEGRLPMTANEVVISDEIAETAGVNYEIGDTLTLGIGPRVSRMEDGKEMHYSQSDPLIKNDEGEWLEQLEVSESGSYKIVGIIKRPTWESSWAPGYTIIAYTDVGLMSKEEQATASVIVSKMNKSLYAKSRELAEAIGVKDHSLRFNNELLRYYGVTSNSDLNLLLYSSTIIIMSIIIVGSVSLIYNAFAISVSERSRYLGMLASVGATKRQKRNSVFFEGAIIGAISIPLGVIGGLIGIGVTFMFVNSTIQDLLGMTVSLNITVTPMSILLACGVSVLTIFISTYVPARKASKVTAIEAIRQTTEVKLTSKAVKTSRLVRKLFGMEAELGLKNLKRNKRRYQATVFSLVISVVLFLSVSFFTENLKKSLVMSQSGANYDIMLGSYNEQLSESFVEAVITLPEVISYSMYNTVWMDTLVEESRIADPLKEQDWKETLNELGGLPYYITMIGMNEQSLRAYAKEAGFDADKLLEPNEANAAIVDIITYRDSNTGRFVQTEAIHTAIGEEIALTMETGEEDTREKHSLGAVTVAALTDKLPAGMSNPGLRGLAIIVSEHTLEQIVKNLDPGSFFSDYSLSLLSSDPIKTERDITEIEEVKSGYYMSNEFESRQKEGQMITLVSVFTYGFIMLITAISVANIFNTISTSISLRKREFGMLKSMGMTPKGFNKMINYESIFYGMKSLLYGLPISIGLMYLMYRSMSNVFEYSFALPWIRVLYVVLAVFLIVSAAMLYSSSKVRRENVIDAIKTENV